MIKIVINKKKIPGIFFVKEIAFPIEYYKSTESYGTAHLTKLKCLENTLQLKYYIYIYIAICIWTKRTCFPQKLVL